MREYFILLEYLHYHRRKTLFQKRRVFPKHTAVPKSLPSIEAADNTYYQGLFSTFVADNAFFVGRLLTTCGDADKQKMGVVSRYTLCHFEKK